MSATATVAGPAITTAERRGPVPAKPEQRLASLDAYRGFIMLVMASGGFGIYEVAKRSFPESRLWQTLGYHFHHVDWLGCAFWDLIQPSFMFMVGVAMAYSYSARQAQGQSYARMLGHAVYRSIVLVLLGVFLRSGGGTQTNFTFMDVVSQIGFGYTFLFLLWNRPRWVEGAAAAVVRVGYGVFFALYPLPPADFDYKSVGVGETWPHLTDFAAHWDKGTNAAANFDVWFLNRFPRTKPFAFEGSGYPTLNFIPSLATMIFGLMAGELLRGSRSKGAKFWILAGSGLAALTVGKLLDVAGICPIVKIIWTPSWAIFSTGWTLWMLAGFYGVIDIVGLRRWSFPLLVVGMNSIVMYCMAGLLKGWFNGRLKIHFGQELYGRVADWLHLGPAYVPIVEHTLVLFAMWLVCLWLYRQKIFVRI